MEITLKEKIKKSLVITLSVLAGFVLTFIASIVANLIFGDYSDEIMNYNPFLNGFIHADPVHLLYNLAMLLIFMFFTVNQKYSIKEFYLITLAISILSLPVSVVIGIPAVGISGTLYFMMSRACLNSKNILMYVIVGGSIIYEFFHVMEIGDGVAHYVHVIGAILGILSLKKPLAYEESKNRLLAKLKNHAF